MRAVLMLGTAFLLPLTPHLARGPRGAQGPALAPYQRYELPNGLVVIIAEDHTVPIMAATLWFRAGSAQESSGRRGFAQLAQRMVFQGTSEVPGQDVQTVQQAGGEFNAATTEDRAGFDVTVPSQYAKLALWVLAGRMKPGPFSEMSLEAQRQGVLQERAGRIDGQPFGSAFVDGIAHAFDSTGCAAYAQPVLPAASDLESATAKDLQAFVDDFYGPANATLVVTGDVSSAEVRDAVQAYFGDATRGAAAPAPVPSCAVTAVSGTEQREDALASYPAAIIAYRIPGHSDPDTPALEVLAHALGQGERSRLQQALVGPGKAAVQAASVLDSRRGGGVLYLFAVGAGTASAERLSQAIAAEVARLTSQGLAADELERVRNQLRMTTVTARLTPQQLAQQLQHYALLHRGLSEFVADTAVRATAVDVKRAAQKYLTPANGRVILVTPAPRGGR